MKNLRYPMTCALAALTCGLVLGGCASTPLAPAEATNFDPREPLYVLAEKKGTPARYTILRVKGVSCTPSNPLPASHHRTCRKPAQVIRWLALDIDTGKPITDADFQIRFDGTTPVEQEEPTAKCKSKTRLGIVKCRVKDNESIGGDYKYTVILDAGTLDPHVYVNRRLDDGQQP